MPHETSLHTYLASAERTHYRHLAEREAHAAEQRGEEPWPDRHIELRAYQLWRERVTNREDA